VLPTNLYKRALGKKHYCVLYYLRQINGSDLSTFNVDIGSKKLF